MSAMIKSYKVSKITFLQGPLHKHYPMNLHLSGRQKGPN